MADRNLRFLLQRFRESAKSTQFILIRCLKRICENRNIRIVIASKTDKAASKFVSTVARQLESNERIIEDYGVFKGKESWSEGQFTVMRDAAYREPTMHSVGRGGQIVSGRYDVVILDDVEDYESTRTPARRLATYEWVMRDVAPVVVAGGQFGIIQTPQHEGDLIGQLKGNKLWHLVNRPSELPLEEPDPVTKVARESMWPEKFPIYYRDCAVKRAEIRRAGEATLAGIAQDECRRCAVYNPEYGDTNGVSCLTGKRFEVSSIFYRLQYLCDITAFGGNVWQEEWWRYYDSNVDLKFDSGTRTWTFKGQPMILSMGIDPAISEENESAPEEHSKFALLVLGFVKSMNLRVVMHIENIRIDFPTQERVILEQYTTWYPQYVIVEEVAYQRALVQSLRKHRIQARGIKPDNDKFRRFVAMTPEFEAGLVYIDLRRHEAFRAQALAFPQGTHDDLLDAYSLARQAFVAPKMFADFGKKGAGDADHPHVIPSPIATPAPHELTTQDILRLANR